MTAANAATHITSAMSSKKFCVTISVCSRAPNTANSPSPQLRRHRGLGRTRRIISNSNAKIGCPCPLWVKSRHDALKPRCPLYPQKRTSVRPPLMSALCQKQTHALQQKGPLFDHLVGEQL